jgi:hypothetical protein
VIVYVAGGPGQLAGAALVGVTVIVAVTGALVVFIPVKEAISPVPFAASPIVVFEFVQVYVAPAGTLVKFVAGTDAPLQYELFAGTVTVGVGLIVMVYVDGGPGQLAGAALVGVTVIVAVIGAVVVFVPVKELMSPVPLAGIPIAVLEFVQL